MNWWAVVRVGLLALMAAACGDNGGNTPQCPTGQTQCGDSCVATSNDPNHCGACGVECDAGKVCSAGTCAASCGTGLTNCNGSCRDLANDPTSCGSCNTECLGDAGGAPVCSAMTCALLCDDGFSNCNNDATDGCEINLATDGKNCGACGSSCDLANGEGACNQAACEVVACEAGFGDCDGAARNGCEVNTQTDSLNCGACGTACGPGLKCSLGTCAASCAAPLVDCGNSCVDVANDRNNCATCGNQCPAPSNALAVCATAACAFVCTSGFGDCDVDGTNGCESEFATDEANCGRCGNVCAPGSGCGGGVCVAPPRLIAPIHTSNVGLRRPTVQVLSSPGSTTTVQFCADRDCTSVIETVTVAGDVARPAADLPTGIVWWRAASDVAGSPLSSTATWYFAVPPRDYGTSDIYWGGRADYNGDGYSDVTVGSRSGNTAWVGLGSATGIPTVPSRVLTGVGGTASTALASPQFGDFNGDGYSDLWLSSIEGGRGFVYFGSTTGIAAAPSQTIMSPGSAGSWFAYRASGAGDVNRDGYADLVINLWGTSPNRAFILYGSATGLGAPVEIMSDTASSVFYRVAGVGDLNGDRYADVALGSNGSSGPVRVFYGSATGLPATPSVIFTPAVGQTWSNPTSATDLNGDGFCDLLLVSQSANNLYFFPGSATGVDPTATPTVIGLGQTAYIAAGMGDINRDGYGDAMYGDSGVTARVVLGGPTPMSSSFTVSNGGRGITATGDVNGDGFNDWVGSNGGTQANIYHGAFGIVAAPAASMVWTPSPGINGFGYPLN